MQNSIENLTDTADIAKTVLANLDSIEPKELQDAVKYLIYENSILKESRELGKKVVDMLMSKLQNTIDISKLSRTDHIKKLIAELKTCTANKYELHRVEVLERDLLEGLPVVEILDDTHQKFDGVKFHRTTDGHYNGVTTIQKAVYSYYYGEIPTDKKYDIHHIDCNPDNNVIENLAMLTKNEHIHLHRKTTKSILKKCAFCGKHFVTHTGFKEAKFCSYACASRSYWTKENRLTKEIEKTCIICGKKFTTRTGYRERKTCSTACWRKRRKK